MDEDKIKDIYLSLKNKNKKEWGELMKQLTKDQKRRLIFYIKKKNKNSLNKIKNIKIEKNSEKIKTKPSNHYQQYILIDYSNVNYDLNLKNYIARILRIYKLEDNFDLVKGLHLYMNILCYVIFKKFTYEYKNDMKNKNLLIFLKKVFPFEFQNFQDIYNMRWNKDFISSENMVNENTVIDEDSTQNGKEVNLLSEEKNNNNTYKKDTIKKDIDQQCNTYSNSNKENANNMENENIWVNDIVSSRDYENPFFYNKNTLNLDGKGNSRINSISKLSNDFVVVKTEKEDDNTSTSKENNNNHVMVQHLSKYIKKEYMFHEFFKNKDIKKIMVNIFDEKRYDYRIRFRSIISKSLNDLEYKKYCDQREKLFKYKKKNFIRWLSQFTNINSLDMYVVNFFIFLFLDRLYLIIETFIRLNYYSIRTADFSSPDHFLENIDEFQNFNDILNYFTNIIQSNVLVNNVGDSTKENIQSISNKDVEHFNKIYHNIVKVNFQNFFLSIDLIYNVDIYNFKIKNKINFEKLIKVDISSYINDTNIYDIIQYDKNNNADPWKVLTNFTLHQNKNLNLQKFDCFSIFLIVRFKYYLEEYKEKANIDCIYKTVKEEFDQVENYLKCHGNKTIEISENAAFSEGIFEYNHLIPLYMDLQNELKKVNEYIKFYGNLISFVNFIQRYAHSASSNVVKLEHNEETKEYFDLSFFLSAHMKGNVKKE
ncbi:conserved Plasmodium protein, unknown function [Plasmodium malariae]|uniref:Uncharacterized protein n=1 Tax=Plasmodium malariae TaxID=5858 RepID=A0A1C3KG04_PLAMA|nr:conserved Plasmodium protein, unknown function [Plasmodium malariae]